MRRVRARGDDGPVEVGGFVGTNDDAIAERLYFLQKSLGAIPGPFDAWLVLRGIKTLAVRMRQHCRNAHAIAGFLELYPNVRGLSTMPPATDDPEDSRPLFRKLRELALEHGLTELSMGTSQDYKVAAEEGATMIRIGSVLYQS